MYQVWNFLSQPYNTEKPTWKTVKGSDTISREKVKAVLKSKKITVEEIDIISTWFVFM